MPNPMPSICVHCDNTACISLVKRANINDKMNRHIKLRHKSIRHWLSTGVISLEHMKSKENLVDHLTKGLLENFIISSSRGMGLKLIKSLMQ